LRRSQVVEWWLKSLMTMSQQDSLIRNSNAEKDPSMHNVSASKVEDVQQIPMLEHLHTRWILK